VRQRRDVGVARALDDVVPCPALHRIDRDRDVVDRRDDDGRGVGMLGRDARHEVAPFHVRKTEAEHDDEAPAPPKRRKTGRGGGRLAHRPSVPGQAAGHAAALLLIVVDEQDVYGVRHPRTRA
jgi:hypothetical protein